MRHWISREAPGLSHLTLATGEIPEPADDEIVVRVHAAALNFSDLLMIDDKYQVRPPRPFTVGQELAGEVVKVGRKANFAVGDRIASKVTWGALAEFARVRADMALPIPEGMEFSAAAALPVSYTTALVGLTECTDMQAGDTVLVHAAAGAVGIAAIQVAKAHGAIVIGTAGGPEKVKLVRSLGCDHALDYRAEDWVAAVRSITEGRGVTTIFDPVGGEIAEKSLRCIARDGTLLVVGFSSGAIPKLAANYLLLKRAAAKGVYWNHDQDQEMLARISARLFQMVAAGCIAPIVQDNYRLEDLPRALADLGERRSVGKLVLRVGEQTGQGGAK